MELTVDHLLQIVEAEGIGPVRDVGLLSSAAQRPWVTVFGKPAYPRLADQAAALLHSIATHHPLVDGNKRLALLAALVFLDVNGARITLDPDETFQLVMDVASGELTEVQAIADRMRVAPLPH
ncbi:death on curing protein [Kytococcus aerolatus]|uniref:Death on curing protein n=1 Tax=Kytococcus aerolatus TaxID=592308 RepID=A0A212U7P3_9MICO|nr:type II toxin-antitoxin system death-on-curing family toxin [Kytococcus aerolatus]SNC74273.1 death on curing protein [Kytococcus aerolatus]